jgi:cbb3-type cytochrome oxidase subunit 1
MRDKVICAVTIVGVMVVAAAVGIVLERVLANPETQMGESSYANGGRIATCIHDGHWFVTMGGNGGGICHHPECPKCQIH